MCTKRQAGRSGEHGMGRQAGVLADRQAGRQAQSYGSIELEIKVVVVLWCRQAGMKYESGHICLIGFR